MRVKTKEDYLGYIYGSADVVGLMCLKVFVKGDQKKYNTLKDYAMKLGSAFQKVNFLRDYKSDLEILKRSYFPNVQLNNLNEDNNLLIDKIKRLQPNTLDLDYLEEKLRKNSGFSMNNEIVVVFD